MPKNSALAIAISLCLSCASTSSQRNPADSNYSLPGEVHEVIALAQQNALDLRIDHRYWDLPSYLGTHYASQLYLFSRYQNVESIFPPAAVAALRERLLAEQRQNGSWHAADDINIESGDLGASIYNYFALKVMGEDIDSKPLSDARNYILTNGGIENAPLFYKIFLALFNNYPWTKIRSIPFVIFNRLVFLEPIQVDKFAQWIGPHLQPIAYLRKYRANKDLDDLFKLKELFVQPVVVANKNRYPVSLALPTMDLMKQILNNQQPKGSWGGYTVATIFTIIALEHFANSKPGRKMTAEIKTRVQKGYSFLAARTFPNNTPNLAGVLDDGKFWDTALIANALIKSGYPPENLWPTATFLLENRSRNGGYPFGEDFWYAPDNDDTAEIIITLNSLGVLRQRIDKSIKSLDQMQNKDGGWAAFAKNNNGNVLLRTFSANFLDSADLFDESSPDVTGHILEAYGEMGFNKINSKVVKRGIAYLQKEVKQTSKRNIPVWQGRWGINYIYGTGAALVGLMRVGEDPKSEYIQKAVAWLKTRQNEDGGFGETTRSYVDFSYAGVGVSTPTQTAWALLGLMAAGETKSLTVQRGITYLVNEFRKHGKWIDQNIVGTGHPGVIYMHYPSYAYAFPLWALAVYAKGTP